MAGTVINNSMKKITKETTLVELLGDEKTERILAKYNLPCLSCPFAHQEMESLKLGDVCKIYNIDAEKLLTELSRIEKAKVKKKAKLSSPKDSNKIYKK